PGARRRGGFFISGSPPPSAESASKRDRMLAFPMPHLASIEDAVYALWLKRIALKAMRFSFV
ncbi:hypothetical protein, partial [Mesorhizobium sp. M7A.F.Ca.CA.002.07.1.1]|uniref:hypothetical protein n=1 Tax=Mesorhizobium sp. M7A.F.Ca.CA.002.07.1.1 TaxID=2496723 RepID=UPI0019CFF26F